MKDRTTVIITILIVLIAGVGVWAEAFLNGSDRLGSGGFREVLLNDPQDTGNITGNITHTGTRNDTNNVTRPGTRPAATTGTGTGPGTGGTGTGTGPGEAINDTNNVTRPGTVQITDALGRNVTVPAQINRVLSGSVPTTVLIYMLAPDKLGGWTGRQTGRFMDQKYRDLPVVGRLDGQTGNFEAFISIRPDIVFSSIREGAPEGDPIAMPIINEQQDRFGQIPVVAVPDVANVLTYSAPIKFMGQVLGAQQRAAELIAFYENVLNRVKRTVSNIPEGERVTVYYAQGPEGLQTGPRGSQHSQLIELAGGKNAADIPGAPFRGRVTVSMEQILNWNPDVILVSDPNFYGRVYNDTRWQNVRAVKDRRVYLIPQDPFNWFDGPPGVNRIIGIPWTAKTLYPERFQDIDMISLTKEFYSKFYNYNLTDDDVNTLLHPKLRSR